MPKGYKPMRVPIEAYKDLKKKKIKMEEVIKKTTGKSRRIPLTNIIRVVSKAPLILEDQDVFRLTKRRPKKRK